MTRQVFFCLTLSFLIFLILKFFSFAENKLDFSHKDFGDLLENREKCWKISNHLRKKERETLEIFPTNIFPNMTAKNK